MKENWVRNVDVISVVDGDSLHLAIDLGLRTHAVALVRLFGLNAPEMSGERKIEGQAAKDWLTQRIATHKGLTARIYKDPEKYGRWLVELFDGEANINQELIAAGHAKPWDGNGIRP